MPNNKLTTTNERIAMTIASKLKTCIPVYDENTSPEMVKSLQIAMIAGINITIDSFHYSLKTHIQSDLIKSYLKNNVKGYK